MRPIKLTMTAFGPYKSTEVIDFTELKDHNLFVISGKTGSGKTTIFDGICFALYGSASGQDRDHQMMLRSDFADDDTHTAVEFEFELHGRHYRILRQLGHVKKGNKTKTGERYEFYEKTPNGEVPCVDRQIVTEINDKIEELIGLTQEQFKQIVMLPQGEFRKLLTSTTENKEEILRRLFKTEPYKQISERLKIKRNELDQAFSQQKQQRDHYIQNIFATIPQREASSLAEILASEHVNTEQVITGLDEEIDYYQQKIIHDQKAYQAAYDAHDKKQRAFYQAKAINDQFLDYDRKQKQLKALKENATHMKEQEQVLKKAEQASQIEPYEAQFIEWQRDEKRRETIFQEATKQKTATEQQLANVTIIYEREQNRKDEREQLRASLDRYQQLLPTVKELAENQTRLVSLQEAVAKSEATLKRVTDELTQKQQVVDETEQQIKKIESQVDQLPDKQQTIANLKEKALVLRDYLKLANHQQQLDQELRTNEQRYQQEKSNYEEKEKIWFSHQASVLAAHLHDGEACPVCGSVDHPQKATVPDEFLSDDELEILKQRLAKQESFYRQALAKHEANKEQMEAKAKELQAFQITIDEATKTYQKTIEEGKALKQQIDELNEKRTQLIESRKKLEQEKTTLKALEEQKQDLEKKYQEQQSAYATTEAVLQERLRTIPEEVRELTELEQKIQTTNKQLDELEKAWELAQQNLQQTREQYTKATADVEHAEQQLTETRAKKDEAKEKFQQAYEQAGFTTEEAYQQAKLPAEQREAIKTSIERYKQQVSTLTEQIKELAEILKDQKRVDLTAMEEELNELKVAYEAAFQTLNQSKDYLEQAVQLRENLIEVDKQVNKVEKQLATVTDLYDVVRGHNFRRISFERYLQIEYLEQIIEAANHRLKDLSNGQFLLMRSDRIESHGRQSGLALDVYDAYTGQTRDVKTLSGGEKFNASLSLALGMSDVIQSFQGNISIQMMFIDEGFGSLDEESLHKAIDTLIDLQQSGRLIGVISHVQELKNVFPAVLEVKKTNEGYSQTKFVIK